ncbi:MAG: CBS domain-containing protein [Phycisphaerae bacterium]|nr:CBS domain-containing protein [Phycisphaerae bacterium]
MKVKDVMTATVRVIDSAEPTQKAAEHMAAMNVGALPVVQEHKLVGMITDRDVVVRVVGQGLDARTTRVGEVMTSGALTLQENDDVADAARTMKDRQVRRVPVVDNEQRVVGIVTLGDLAVKTGSEGQTLAGEALQGVSTPAEPNL